MARSSQWVRADRDGVFRPLVALGQRVKRGAVMGMINSPFADGEQLEEFTSAIIDDGPVIDGEPPIVP